LWATSCRWFDLETVNVADVTSDPSAQFELTVDIAQVLAKRGRRREAVQRMRAAAALAKDVFWEWIDGYCHGDVAPLVNEQSPNAGALWGPLTVGQKAEALRLGQSWSALWSIRTADAWLLLLDVVPDLIDAADVDPPD
jgi:hypothetical protein